MTAEPAKKIDLFAGKKQNRELDQVKDIVSQASDLQPLKPYDEPGKKTVSNIIRMGREMVKKIKDHHDPIKRAAKRTHEVACEKEREALKPVQDAIDKAQSMLNAVTNEERRIEQEKKDEAERLAREEAMKKREAAEKMTADLIAKSDSLVEKAKLIESALDDDATSEEEAAVLRRQLTIINAKLENDEQAIAEAQYAAEEPVYVPAVEEQKVEGIGKGDKVEVEVKSLKELCAAIGRGDVPEAAVKPTKGKLNTYAKDGMKLPGCIIHRSAKAIVR